MGPGENAQSDQVNILLHRRRENLLRRLMQTGIDDFKPGIAESPGYDPCSPVMPVL